MELSSLVFNYIIKDKKFEFMNYKFDVLSEVNSKEELIESAKSSLTSLENLLDRHYLGENFSKTKNGEISSSTIEVGYDYSSTILSPIFKITLRYVILSNSSGKLENLFIDMRHIHDSDGILTIFDSVITLPNLKISNNAQIQIERINFLRKEEFELKQYLSLPSE